VLVLTDNWIPQGIITPAQKDLKKALLERETANARERDRFGQLPGIAEQGSRRQPVHQRKDRDRVLPRMLWLAQAFA
jgi:hypothetical protein